MECQSIIASALPGRISSNIAAEVHEHYRSKSTFKGALKTAVVVGGVDQDLATLTATATTTMTIINTNTRRTTAMIPVDKKRQ